MLRVYALARRAASANLPVLIVGETGTGKEFVALTLHRSGVHGAGPFVALNCGALPPTLVESALFGHMRGAFTGAERNQQGAFQQAHGGTLFLDEVGELSPAAQVALLRAIETGRVRPVGATEETEVRVRIVAATNRDLETMVAHSSFRRDLLHRIDAVTLAIPPLRERREEIEPLACDFLEQTRQRIARPEAGPLGFEPAALERLRTYAWPGNVRELRNAVERAVALCEGEMIGLLDLPERVLQEPAQNANQTRQEQAALEASHAAQGCQGSGYRSRLRAYETELLLEGLRLAGGNQCRAAQLLEMPRRTLCRRIKDLGLERAYATSQG
jgi:DNA-binding NtrC family response regulator